MVFSVVVNTEYFAACHNFQLSQSQCFSACCLVMEHYLVLDIHVYIRFTYQCKTH